MIRHGSGPKAQRRDAGKCPYWLEDGHEGAFVEILADEG